MYYPSANRVQQFQANSLRKMAADKKQEGNQPGLAPNSYLSDVMGWVTDPYNMTMENMKRHQQLEQEFIDAQNEIRNLKQLGPTIERSRAYDRYNKAAKALGGEHPTAQEFDLQPFKDAKAAARRERIKQVLLSYAPYVGGGAALGALLGGYIGYRNNQTLAGSLLGGLGGAGLAAGAKYLYDRYNAQA